jgi:lysophospholipase L1-like esterase
MRYSPLLFFLILFAGCVSDTATPISGEDDMPPVRYLALGDSYTIGESVPETERWPSQLVRLLENEGLDVEVTIIARTGWTVDELWQGIQAREIAPPYDMVSLLIGVNDQYRGYEVREYRKQFIFLVNKAIHYAGGDPHRVIVLSIPDWSVTPFATGRDREQVARQIDEFNSVNREESEKAVVLYVDVTPISREAAGDESLLASDGLHPSGKMYAMWAEMVLPKALDILK